VLLPRNKQGFTSNRLCAIGKGQVKKENKECCMAKMLKKEEQEFLDEINLCLQKARGIKNLMKRLEVALKSLSKDDYCEITHAAMQDLNELLKGLINTWDLWSSGVSIELDRLNKLEQQNKKAQQDKL